MSDPAEAGARRDDSGMSSSSTNVPRRHHLFRMTTENRYGLVLVLLLLTYVVSATVDGEIAASVVVLIQLVTVRLAFTVSESYRSRTLVGFAIVLVIAAVVAGAVFGSVGTSGTLVTGVVYSVNAILYLIASVLILVHLVRRRVVDLQTFLGAIAAYIMIGLMFAFSYRALGDMQAGPFFGAAGDGSTADDLFFSFITLTTTGYGNLVPASNPGQSLAVLEAVTGQLFLVTAVAKIVTSWNPMAGRGASPGAGGGPEAGPESGSGRVGA